MSGRVVGFDEALEIVRGEAMAAARGGEARVRTERMELLEGAGRVLAQDVTAERDQPPFDRSTRDGYAVQAAKVAGGATLRVAGSVRAGERWTGAELAAGEAIEIMTGAPLPEGADAVLMVEHTAAENGYVRVEDERSLRAGENVVAQGAEAREGGVVLRAGTRLGAAEIALAASCGREKMEVFARPRVAIVATGDELVELGERPEPWQIWNSNGYAIAAMVTEAGATAGRMPVARDLRAEIRERVAEGRMWDLLLLSGGVSMGKYDLVEEVLAEFGAEFLFTGVRMQPGKPLVFGRLPAGEDGRECLFFGLPGNPVSTEVTFRCFAEPLVRVLGGGEWVGPPFVQATLSAAVEGKPGLMRLLPARLVSSRERPEVRVVGWKGSGDLAANARANCYAVLPGEVEGFAAGDVISVLLR